MLPAVYDSSISYLRFRFQLAALHAKFEPQIVISINKLHSTLTYFEKAFSKHILKKPFQNLNFCIYTSNIL